MKDWRTGVVGAAWVVGLALLAGGCGSGADDSAGTTGVDAADLDRSLRAALVANGIAPVARTSESDALYSLGLNLFQSTILSGNRRVSCASCHPVGNAGVDALPLAIGVDGSGSPPARTGTPVIHRNTPSLINVALAGRSAMFWDGRVQAVADGFRSPAGARLPAGLSNVAAVQSLFPLLSRSEMLGSNDGTDANELADLNPPGASVDADPQPVWNGLMARLRADATFAALLRAAFPDRALDAIGIEAVGNALAAFESRRWYDFGSSNALLAYLAGSRELPAAAKRGGLLFFDKARCVRCHAGPLFSDQKFHNLAVPQIGPGFGSGAAMTPPRDLGRFEVSGLDADRYAFLTPSLWEVSQTWPYFHDGVYSTLEAAVRHHLDVAAQSRAFRCSSAPTGAGQTLGCRDALSDPALVEDMVARRDVELTTPIVLDDAEIADLLAFLATLTDGNNNMPR